MKQQGARKGEEGQSGRARVGQKRIEAKTLRGVQGDRPIQGRRSPDGGPIRKTLKEKKKKGLQDPREKKKHVEVGKWGQGGSWVS